MEHPALYTLGLEADPVTPLFALSNSLSIIAESIPPDLADPDGVIRRMQDSGAPPPVLSAMLAFVQFAAAISGQANKGAAFLEAASRDARAFKRGPVPVDTAAVVCQAGAVFDHAVDSIRAWFDSAKLQAERLDAAVMAVAQGRARVMVSTAGLAVVPPVATIAAVPRA